LLFCAAPARAEEVLPPSPLDARDFELLPLNELERKEFGRDHAELTRKVTVLARRANKLRGHLAARDGIDDGSRKLASQIEQMEADLAPLMAEAVARVREAQPEVDARLLAHIRNAPQGARRIARYAAGLPLYVEGVPEAARAVLLHVLPRYEGALIALDAQQRRLRAVPADDAAKRVAAEDVETQMRRVERRYWRLVDYILPEAARAAVHRVLPSAYQRRADVLRYLYAVPGLTPSQATRISALLKEVESESAPDQAAVKRLTAA
jgi:hypothetical protein